MARIAPTAANGDRLGLSKVDSDVVLRKVMDTADSLTSPQLTTTMFRHLCATDELPEGYRNLVLIMAADAARRRNWNAEKDHAASQCTNPVLQAAWDQWKQRHKSE